MTDSQIIQATYSDYRRVKGRKVFQLICEVPIEHAPVVHSTFGEPQFSDREIVVAIAKIDPATLRKAEPEPTAEKPKSYATHAALACKEIPFQRFCAERVPEHLRETISEEYAAVLVREHCGAASRADLVAGSEAGRLWRELHQDFKIWLNM